MHRIELEILKLFKQDPGIELGTGDVVRNVLGEEYAIIKPALYRDASIEEGRVAKRAKARLHRRVLYHLNKLVEDEILSIVKVVGKGEKVFRLGLESGDYIIEKGKRRILISKPANMQIPIEGLQNEGVVTKFEPSTWITRLNAIFLEAPEFPGLSSLGQTIHECFSIVNDVIAINRFEKVLDDVELVDMRAFLEKLEIDAADYNKKVCLVISLLGEFDQTRLRLFIEEYAKKKPVHMNIVFNITLNVLKKEREILELIIKEFSREKIKINLKNSTVHPGIYVIGRAGVYAMDAEDWKNYLRECRGKTKGAAIAQSSLAIDVATLFSEKVSSAKFQEVILKCAKALLRVNTLQRQHAEEYFTVLGKLSNGVLQNFLRYSRLYLRLWNYDWSDEGRINNLLAEADERLKIFAVSEETIFKSCGMPVRFRVAMSSAFMKFNTELLSARVYKKSKIHGLDDLMAKDVVAYLQVRERLMRWLRGGDRVRFFRQSEVAIESIIKEWMYLLSTPQIPTFTYDFRGLSGDLRLTSFI